MTAVATVARAITRAVAPRKALTVSEWADEHRYLSSKQSPKPGRWRTDNNPPLREPMDCFSARSPVQDIVLMFPIQFGKSEVETNAVGYIMEHAPGPLMVCLPGEVSMNKWINQKLNPLIDETPKVREVLTSTASRNAANQKDFKDFAGGQLYVEHAGSPARLKSTTVRYLLVDELTEFANSLKDGDDPLKMLEGRTSAFPSRYKRGYVSTPGVRGACRTTDLWERSDQRLYNVPCPHCGELQSLEWEGLTWPEGSTADTLKEVWYVCRECGALIEEHHKTQMLRDAKAGGIARWVPTHPGRRIRGYHINCLYYQIGMGPRWLDLVRMWLEAQGDPAALKTFVNDRLARAWEERSLKNVRANLIKDRAEPIPLGVAPWGVVWITAGVDTQDDRLEVQIVGWGRNRRGAILGYVVILGDPQHDEVWIELTDLINRGIRHESGLLLPISATAIDGRGHRTQAVKDYARKALIRRPMVIFGAKAANAVPLSKPKIEDTTYKGKADTSDNALRTWTVGTVNIKHTLYRRLAADADLVEQAAADPKKQDPALRHFRFPDSLSDDYFGGLVSEIFDPAKGRYVKRKGAARNEPLDTLVYAWAATQHPELQLEKKSAKDWDADELRIAALAGKPPGAAAADHPQPAAAATAAPAPPPASTNQPTQPRHRPARRATQSRYLAR
ncbi:phage terminase large subunit family protein [Thauera sp.]|uniref:phage terminase large subunit family protein n=1 Tax=Thauera sp. TaxID=1905334 RepID=UPI0039E58C80